MNFISSKDSEEERVMHSSSDNIKFTPESYPNDVIEKPFKSFYSKCPVNLERSMKRSDFIFNSINVLQMS